MSPREDAPTGQVPVLSITRVSAGYGSAAILREVSFTVNAGEAVAILGRNGAGKTTLLRSIMGIVKPNSGDVVLEGEKMLTGLRPDQVATAGLGYVPQGRGIFRKLSVRENLQIAQYSHRVPATCIDESLALFPALGPLLERAGGALSGGQQQILALARAMVGRPKVLLLDEPSEGIQPSIIDELLATLTALCERKQCCVLLVEQNLDFAGALAKRGYVLEMGRIARELDEQALAASEQLARALIVMDREA